VIFFSVLCVPAQIIVKLIKLITTANLPISYEDLARELSIDEVLIKLRLSELYESGFPIELTEITVRMKTQAEFKHKKKRLTR
jgi:chromosome segregation and condensation protein ScpB